MLPAEQALLAVAYQPDSPLEFENPKLLQQIGGHWGQSFNVRNRGTKPIRAFDIGTSAGSGWGWKANDPSAFIVPGQRPGREEADDDEIIPLTEQLRDQLKLRGPMKGVVILMVVRVEYADGSVYDAGQAFEAMQEFFLRVDAGLYMLESRRK